jgi:MFS family permease
MTQRRALPIHYAYVVLAITFLSLLAAAALRSAPSVLIVPLELSFGWDRATVSTAAGVGIFLYGLVGPFAAALMQSYGIKKIMLAGLVLMAGSTFASLFMQQAWQFILTWGVISGVGSGAVASVLGAAVVNRWFARRQGLMMGVLTASTATGALVFLPLMAHLSETGAWRPVVVVVTLALAALIPIVWLFMPERPQDHGLARYGEAPDTPAPAQPTGNRALLAITVLRRAAKAPTFWLLFAAFFICGLTTNGLVGTHMIAFCGDKGIAPVQAAGLLTLMGLFDLVGTTASGWLTDRYDARRLLFIYYGLRGLSLIALPFLDFGAASLTMFAVFYGLDWIATVPPTVRLANARFGETDGPIVYGWIFTGHQAGAATAAIGAGLIRQVTGDYGPAFMAAGVFAVAIALVLIAWPREPAAFPAVAE